jgi:hypothetical protein
MANDPLPNDKPRDDEYESLNEFMTASDITLTNALLPDVWPLLEKVGYRTTDMSSKTAELQVLRGLSQRKEKEYGDQYKASAEYKEQLDLLNTDYPSHVALARIEFEEDAAALTTLGLVGKRLRNRSDYSKQALQLYDGALANTDYATALANNGIDAAKLTAMQSGFLQLEKLDAAQTKETGEAQEATVARDQAWDKLETWMRKFYKKAKVALRDHPQLREKLGLLER